MSTDIKRAYAAFTSDIRDHQMTVLRDDGLYRHLKFNATEHSWNCWFELVTWPGALCVRGDHGTYVFQCTDDMFGFFRATDTINPSYWGEKCVAQDKTSPVDGHSSTRFEESVRRHVDDWIDYSYLDEEDAAEAIADLRRQVCDEVIAESEHRETAVAAVEEFRWAWRPAGSSRPKYHFQFDDWYDHITFDDYDYHFLWCLYAVLWGIRVYDATKAGGDVSQVTVDVPSWVREPDPVPDMWIQGQEHATRVTAHAVRPIVDVVASL